MRLQAISTLLAALFWSGCDRSRSHANAAPVGDVVVGKLLIQAPSLRISRDSANDSTEKFFEDQMTALRSPKLRLVAEELLLKENSSWKPSEVKLETAHVRGSSIVSLIGRGGASECARSLIDLIMDEYLKSIALIRPQGSDLMSETSRTQKGLQDAELAWNSFKLNSDLTHAASNLSSLQRRMKQLNAARTFFQKEIESSTRLSLEQDIERRKISNLPPDMPAEFSSMARSSPTASELAYLEVIRQTNAVATEAARKEVTNDRALRLDSHRRQVELLDELVAGIQTEITKHNAVMQQAQAMEQTYAAAETAYKIAKNKEMNDGMPADSSIIHPAVASVVERATVIKVPK